MSDTFFSDNQRTLMLECILVLGCLIAIVVFARKRDLWKVAVYSIAVLMLFANFTEDISLEHHRRALVLKCLTGGRWLRPTLFSVVALSGVSLYMRQKKWWSVMLICVITCVYVLFLLRDPPWVVP